MEKKLPKIIREKKFDRRKYRRVFFKWMTGLFSIKPKNLEEFEFIKYLGLKNYDPPDFNFLENEIEIFSEYANYYKNKYDRKKLMSDWLEAAESKHVEVFRGFFKNFTLGKYDGDDVFNYKEKKPPKGTKPVYFFDPDQGTVSSLRRKVIRGEFISNNILYATTKLFRKLHFLEKKKFRTLGGRSSWRIKGKNGYIITLDFEREKFKPVFNKLGVDIWDKPNGDIGY
ncbi:MAG: hypothetical protein R6U26_03620 [Candidatus Undinarchaeales archaeon]